MSRSKVPVLVAAFVVLLAFAYGAAQSPPKERSQPFSGELIVVYSAALKRATVALSNPTIKTVGGRAFIVGKAIDPGHGVEWRAGAAAVWHPVDDAVQLVEYAQTETYLKLKDSDAYRKLKEEYGDLPDM